MGKPPRGSIIQAVPLGLALLVVALFVLGYFAVVYVLASIPGDPCACPSDILLGAATKGSCDGATTYNLTVAGTSSTFTTASIGLKIILAGTSNVSPPGSGGALGTTACGVAPPTSGWIVILSSQGGQVQQAYFGSSGWVAWNATLPVTLVSGQSMTVVAASSVDLLQASLMVYGMNGAAASGSTTL